MVLRLLSLCFLRGRMQGSHQCTQIVSDLFCLCTCTLNTKTKYRCTHSCIRVDIHTHQAECLLNHVQLSLLLGLKQPCLRLPVLLLPAPTMRANCPRFARALRPLPSRRGPALRGHQLGFVCEQLLNLLDNPGLLCPRAHHTSSPTPATASSSTPIYPLIRVSQPHRQSKVAQTTLHPTRQNLLLRTIFAFAFLGRLVRLGNACSDGGFAHSFRRLRASSGWAF